MVFTILVLLLNSEKISHSSSSSQPIDTIKSVSPLWKSLLVTFALMSHFINGAKGKQSHSALHLSEENVVIY